MLTQLLTLYCDFAYILAATRRPKGGELQIIVKKRGNDLKPHLIEMALKHGTISLLISSIDCAMFK